MPLVETQPDPGSYLPSDELARRVVEAGFSARYEDARELVKRGEEVVPILGKYVRDAEYWYGDKQGRIIASNFAPILALHLLGAISSISALEDVLFSLYTHGDDLGDFLTEDMASILSRFGTEAVPRLRDAVNDKKLDFFARNACMRALAMIARREEESRGKIIEFLKEFIQRKNEKRDLIAETIWSLAELKEESALPSIKKAYKENRVETRLIPYEDVLDIFAEENEQNFEYHHDEKDPLDFFQESNLEYLREINLPASSVSAEESGYYEKVKRRNSRVSATEPTTKVGRNNPCPCGSGRKYKKCCWSKDMGLKKC